MYDRPWGEFHHIFQIHTSSVHAAAIAPFRNWLTRWDVLPEPLSTRG